MGKLADLIRRHQVIAFFAITFAISMVQSRIPALKNYLSSLVRLRGVWGWSLLALALYPALALLSILFSSLLAWSAAALVMILVDRMWKKLPSDHPAVVHAPLHVSL
jgi:hypothetical protein